MKKLCTFPELTQCYLTKSILELNEIECFIKNENLSVFSGILPVWPELWILNDEQFNDAVKILDDLKNQKDCQAENPDKDCPE